LKQEDLKRFALLVEFTEEDRSEFVDLVDEVSLSSGETLFAESDEADSLYLVIEGQLRVSSEASGTLGLVTEGAAIGAISLVVIGMRQASVQAESDCRLLMLSRGSFRRLAEDAPRTACRLAEAIVHELANGLRPQLSALAEALSGFDESPPG
jgi:CRP-like cAMP-binding protein